MDMIKSKKRIRDLGEVYTPPNIVSEMIDLIPEDKWKDPSFTVVEPTCGNGNFLEGVVKKKIDCGLTPLQALNTTFGTDICSENIEEARHRLLSLIIDIIPKIKMSDKRIATCIIHHNVFVVNDFLKTTSAIQDKPFFVKTKGLLEPILDKKVRENIENSIKTVKIDNNFNFVTKLGNNSIFKKYDDSGQILLDFI